MIQLESKRDHIFALIGIIGVIISIFEHGNGDINYYILPLFYVINICYIRIYGEYSRKLSLIIIDVLMCVRYVGLPVCYYITNVNPISYHGEYEFESIFLMVYEMLTVTMTINLLAPKIFQNKQQEDDNDIYFSNIQTRKPGIIIIVILFIGVLLTHPQYFANLFVFSFTDFQEVENNSDINGFYNLIYKTGIIVVGCVLISKFASLQSRSKKQFLLCLISSWLIIWIASVGTSGLVSRTTFLTNGIIFTGMVLNVYPEKKKAILYGSTTVVLLFLIYGTISRFYSYATNSSTFWTGILSYETLDSYFGGLRDVTVAVKMKAQQGSQLSFSALFNDLFAGVPFLASRSGMDFTHRIVYYFNTTFFGYSGNVSRICPLIGQGYAYLGLVISPLFTCICVYLAMKTNVILEKSRNELLIYISSLMLYYLSAYSMYNLNIIAGGIWNKLLPLFLVYFFSRNISCEAKHY